jgi:hypothetical protein
MKHTLRPVAAVAAAVALACSVAPVSAQKVPPPPAGTSAVVSTTNGILTLEIENSSTSNLGMWSVSTGASHPVPNSRVLYPIGTSYISFRDATASIMYGNASSATAGLTGYTYQNMSTAPGSGVVSTIPNGYRTLWTIPSWTVQQDVTLNGSAITNTNVQQTVTVCNTSTATRTYGVRYMWDWMIAGNDASFFRTRNPDGTFTSTFATFANPVFQQFEEVNNIATPAFSVFGTVGGGSLVPTPTTPEQLRYAPWGTSMGSAWDFTNTGGGSDSSTVHYWGFTTPLSLAAGACSSFTEYLATNPSAVGVTPTGPGTPIPTLSEWALILLATMLGGITVFSMRRRAR